MVRVFISYSHTDCGFVDRLTTELKQHGIEVWHDAKEIVVGDSITARVEQGISKSDFFSLVLSRKSSHRPWVLREYQTALHLQLSNNGADLLPIIRST